MDAFENNWEGLSGSARAESAGYSCAWCGTRNHTFVDPSQGEDQEYIEDCQVCCNPNLIRVSRSPDGNWQLDPEQG
jgi:hypothetical protein